MTLSFFFLFSPFLLTSPRLLWSFNEEVIFFFFVTFTLSNPICRSPGSEPLSRSLTYLLTLQGHFPHTSLPHSPLSRDSKPAYLVVASFYLFFFFFFCFPPRNDLNLKKFLFPFSGPTLQANLQVSSLFIIDLDRNV